MFGVSGGKEPDVVDYIQKQIEVVFDFNHCLIDAFSITTIIHNKIFIDYIDLYTSLFFIYYIYIFSHWCRNQCLVKNQKGIKSFIYLFQLKTLKNND